MQNQNASVQPINQLQAEPANQWCADDLHKALTGAAIFEIGRRTAVNQQLMRGLKLSIKPDNVRKDIMRSWLDAAAQAGNA